MNILVIISLLLLCQTSTLTCKTFSYKTWFSGSTKVQKAEIQQPYNLKIYIQFQISLCTIFNCFNNFLWLTFLSVLGDSPGKNIGVYYHALLQGIFPTQGSKPGLPHCRQTYTSAHRNIIKIVKNQCLPTTESINNLCTVHAMDYSEI